MSKLWLAIILFSIPCFGQIINPGGGSGSVSSVTFTGDGTVLSSTPSAAVTTSGTVAGTLANASAGGFLGNVTSAAASPAYVQLSSNNPQTATYQVLATDFSGYKMINVASGTFTITLVASGAQPTAGQYIHIVNFGSGAVTIARSGQNINGAVTNLTLPPANNAQQPTDTWVESDGANYFASIGGGNATTLGGKTFGTPNPIGSGTPNTGAFTTLTGTTLNTTTNCASGASPAVCGSAASGSVAVPAGTNATLQVNTSAVTANSVIIMESDETLGTKLSVTCNSTLASVIVEPVITARSAGASFTVTISGTTTTNPVCLNYAIIN